MRLLTLILLISVMAGCTGGTVIFAPTPAPPDVSPLRYEHPAGVFSLVVPRNWSVFPQNLTTVAAVAFAPPGEDEPLVLVSVINTGQELNAQQMGEMMLQYQTQIRADLPHYKEQDRQAQGDGSWRLTGLRNSVEGQTQQINTFVQRTGTLLSVIEVIVPVDTARRTEIQSIINTFQVNAAAELPVAELSALGTGARASLEILNVSAWTTPGGVFYITGEVANRGTQSLANVPVTGRLYSADHAGLAEAIDLVMGHALPAGGFAPFSLRFGQGQPADAVRYTLQLGGEEWQPSDAAEIISGEALSWTDETSTNQNGQLLVGGVVTNIGTRAVRDGRAIVTLFDAEQYVIAAGFAELDRPLLPPGESANYLILVPDLGGTAASYLVNIQGFPAE